MRPRALLVLAKPPRRWRPKLLFITTLALLALSCWLYHRLTSEGARSREALAVDRREVHRELSDVYNILSDLINEVQDMPDHIRYRSRRALDKLDKYLGMKQAGITCGNNASWPLVCPERYDGFKWDGSKSWVMEDCSVSGPDWASLVTIVTIVSEWIELERSLRLLQDGKVAVVAGATRNSTGHWRASCYQASVRNYHLNLFPGYEWSACDCMLCGAVGNAPFLTLKLNKLGLLSLLCPDIMYLTHSSIQHEDSFSREDWLDLARAHEFQGVVLDPSPRVEHAFSCEDAGLTCDLKAASEAARLAPWCCTASYARILRAIEATSSEVGAHYEISSGSLLGAVKLGNFMPWDIDGDVQIQSEKMPLFRPGRRGHEVFERFGLSTSQHSEDNYAVRDVGSFLLSHSGVDFEMMGERNMITWGAHPELKHPTRMLVGDLWVRAHVNPGRYARSRYGPGYLRHAQSWRYEDEMGSAFGAYPSGSFRPCDDPAEHSCLERYPADGNAEFNPAYFKAWHREATLNGQW